VSVTRRRFVAVASSALVFAAAAVPTSAQRFLSPQPNNPKGRRKIYRLSSRGRRHVSKKTKAHNASLRFATKETANWYRAHRYDRSRIVALDVSVEEYHRLFVSRHRQIADLRDLKRFAAVRR
jgi:hypothetical protein